MDTILVVVDRFSKFGHFMALHHPFTAVEVAELFLDNIFKLHGMPDSIVCDRDKIFTSVFWGSLFEKLGISMHFSTAYHPQSDGQTERVNQCLESYLRCFTGDRPHSWKQWLSLAEYWYNTTYHTSLGSTPFEVLYGDKPVPLNLGELHDMVIPVAQDMLQQRQVVLQVAKESLTKAQHRMKFYADQKRTERMLDKVGTVAYRLKLPSHSRVHPVFHVSLLKKHVGPAPIMEGELPQTNEADIVTLEPSRVLQRRQVQRQGQNITQWLVQWKGLESYEASWEDVSFITNQFPQFQA
ncbi:hypothetical protein DCAR_0624579 [Daucus carota subsp. sativus]|uniref:Integrase catalytic domain-containing protein n=1 Tax=Daucus carota subsp. sativus TaxID=79200 RepID=A0AAF1B3U3_DAUCS|nr:hypothetical protein DCAR_0624579 [Daucus carota subsp. sativus]